MNHHFAQLDNGVSAVDVETAPAFITVVVATVLLALNLHVLWRFLNHIKKYFSSSSAAANLEPSTIASVEKILNYKFKNKNLLEEALTHSSCSENISYERLEFLGDAAIALTVAIHFFNLDRKLKPGPLTDLRKECVSNEHLADLAAKHGLYRFVRSKNTAPFDRDVKKYEEAVKKQRDGLDITAKPPSTWADIVESLIGAVYLDANCDMTKLKRIFDDLLMLDEIMLPNDEAVELSEISGAQDELYGLCGKRNWPKPFYRSVKNEGQPHEKKYVYSVEIETDDGVIKEEGCRKSTKRYAKNSAAYRLLHTQLQEYRNM